MNNLAIYDQNSGCLEDIYQKCSEKFNTKIFNSINNLMYDYKYLKTLDILIAHVKAEKDFESIKKIKETKPDLIILFYGSDVELILSAFEIPHLYCMMIHDLKSTLPKAFQKLDEELLELNYRHSMSNVSSIPVEDVLMLEKCGNQVRIVTEDYELLAFMSFDDIVKSMEEANFININNERLLNKKYFTKESYQGSNLFLKHVFE